MGFLSIKSVAKFHKSRSKFTIRRRAILYL